MEVFVVSVSLVCVLLIVHATGPYLLLISGLRNKPHSVRDYIDTRDKQQFKLSDFIEVFKNVCVVGSNE